MTATMKTTAMSNESGSSRYNRSNRDRNGQEIGEMTYWKRRHCAIDRQEKFRVFSEPTRLHNFQERSSGTKTLPSWVRQSTRARTLVSPLDPMRPVTRKKPQNPQFLGRIPCLVNASWTDESTVWLNTSGYQTKIQRMSKRDLKVFFLKYFLNTRRVP